MAESIYERRLKEASQLIEQGMHRQAVETAGGAIDLLMKELFDQEVRPDGRVAYLKWEFTLKFPFQMCHLWKWPDFLLTK